MAIQAFTFINWKSEITTEQQNDLLKRWREANEKHGNKIVNYLFAPFGSEHERVLVWELPNYAGLDKLVEIPELAEIVKELYEKTKNRYHMLLRTLPLP
jgi:hypothetical protein